MAQFDSISCFALEGVAIEIASKGVRINAVNPGLYKLSTFDDLIKKMKSIVTKIAMRHLFHVYGHWTWTSISMFTNPAVIDTDFHTTNYGIEQDQAEFNKNFLEQCSSKHPLQRVGNTDDCVNAIAFLASSNSDFITGTLLPVNSK